MSGGKSGPLMAGRGRIVLLLAMLLACAASVPARGADETAAETATGALPEGCPFQPLIADPKTPRFMMSLLHADRDVSDTTLWTVAFGENFGFHHWGGSGGEDGVQLGVSAAVLAQFDLEAPSSDLINADYVVGFPLDYRAGAFSARVRIYHQSSHLGDEYLLREHPERVNLSFEAVETLFSLDFLALRIYAGGEYLMHREPADLEPWIAHGGVEYRRRDPLFSVGTLADCYPMAGLDARLLEQNDWTPGLSLKGGFEFRHHDPAKRHRRYFRFLVEYYDGPSPYGQFYEEQVTCKGASIQVGF